MKHFTATFFTILAILYLADRYTGFDMMPIILIIASCILIIVTVLAVMGGILQKNLFSFTIIILTLFILVGLFL